MPNYLRGASVVVILLLAVVSAATVYLQSLSAIRASEGELASMRAHLIGQKLEVGARDIRRLASGIDNRRAQSSDVEEPEWLWRFVPGTVAGLDRIGDRGAEIGRELSAVRSHAHRLSYLSRRDSDFARIAYRSDRGFTYVMPPVADGRLDAFHQFVMGLEWLDHAGPQWKFTAGDTPGAGEAESALWLGVPLSSAGLARGYLAAQIRVEQLRPLLGRGDSIGRSALTGAGGRLAAAPIPRVDGPSEGDRFFQQRLSDELRFIHRFPPGEPYWAAARASALPWSLVVLAAGLVGLTIHRAQRAEINERKRAERELRHAHGTQQELASRLRSLAHQLTTIQQRERKRLAALLHDDLQQLLVAARIKQGQARYEEASELIAQAIDGSRDLAHELRPPAVYEAGLVPALRWLAERMQRQHSLEVTIEAPHPDITEGLRDDLKMALFDGVREVLFNVVKHARAESAAVKIRSSGSRVTVAVRDQGAGFNPGPSTQDACSENVGFGLFGLEERMTALGGEMTVNSSVGQGTVVRLCMPLGQAADEPETCADGASVAAKDPGSDSNAPDAPLRVVIADDHAVVRQSIASVLNADPRVTVVGEACDGAEVIEAVERHQPDAALVDVNMPGMNGIEATENICDRWPGVVVFGLSVQEDLAVADAMRRAGAATLFPKSLDVEALIAEATGLAAADPRGDA